MYVNQYGRTAQPAGVYEPRWRDQHPSRIPTLVSVRLQMIADREECAITIDVLASRYV